MSKAPHPPPNSVVLLILDGWGHRDDPKDNAVLQAHTPIWDSILANHPTTLLTASGRSVGLPDGQMGNSEVGHLNLGAGRIVPQDIVRISDAIDSGDFFHNETLLRLCHTVRERGTTLHLMGLVGTGGVHASHHHLEGALELAVNERVPRVAIHAFLDGRDSPPTSGAGYLEAVQQCADIATAAGTLTFVATVIGRYYAMDRDKRWERTQLAYQAIVQGNAVPIDDPVTAVRQAYQHGETDEFLKPMITKDQTAHTTLQNGDGVFCLNFRADRMRQMVRALAWTGFDQFDTQGRPSIDLATMTHYEDAFPFPPAFPPKTIDNLVGEVVANAGLRQFRTAETEKYAHVTYFFNGGRETPLHGEDRSMIPSPKVATYDLQPEMSAREITVGLCGAIRSGEYAFLLCNYANGDMVGHSGVLGAAIEAVETVDAYVGQVLNAAKESDTTVVITADHGNCEMMVDPVTGLPHTAHTTNPVPFVIVGRSVSGYRTDGILGDVGPTVLNLIGLSPSASMTGHDLRLGDFS